MDKTGKKGFPLLCDSSTYKRALIHKPLIIKPFVLPPGLLNTGLSDTSYSFGMNATVRKDESTEICIYSPMPGNRNILNYGLYATYYVGPSRKSWEFDNPEVMAIKIVYHSIFMLRDLQYGKKCLKDVMNKLNININFIEYTKEVHDMESATFPEFYKYVTDNTPKYKSNPFLLTAITSVSYLALYKRMKDTYEQWMEKQLSTLLQSCGVDFDLYKPTTEGQMTFRVYNRFNVFVIPTFMLRREFFYSVAHIHTEVPKTIFEQIARVIMNELSYADMTHVRLINDFIIPNQALFSYHWLQGEHAAVLRMVKASLNYDPKNLPYLRFIYSKQELSAFDRDSMQNTYNMARYIALKSDSRYKYIMAGFSGTIDPYKEIYDGYTKYRTLLKKNN